MRGDWFALGTTTGTANQVVQVPTNGSATGYVPGVWIAKVASPATDEDWEYYPSIYAAGMIAANLGTDARSKFVLMGTNGSNYDWPQWNGGGWICPPGGSGDPHP
ncbi:MAG: hypothetical protein U5N55_10685 [Cypionkella sp.]|nr:hypothetical protein [Cypionkella sp.]